MWYVIAWAERPNIYPFAFLVAWDLLLLGTICDYGVSDTKTCIPCRCKVIEGWYNTHDVYMLQLPEELTKNWTSRSDKVESSACAICHIERALIMIPVHPVTCQNSHSQVRYSAIIFRIFGHLCRILRMKRLEGCLSFSYRRRRVAAPGNLSSDLVHMFHTRLHPWWSGSQRERKT